MSYILVQQTEHLKAASRPKCRNAVPILGSLGVTSPLWAVTRMGESRGLTRQGDHQPPQANLPQRLGVLSDSHTHTLTRHSLFKLSTPPILSLLLLLHSIAKYGRPPPPPSAVHLCHLPLYSFTIFLHHQHQSLGAPPFTSLTVIKIALFLEDLLHHLP